MKILKIIKISFVALMISAFLTSCNAFNRGEIVNTEYILTTSIRNGKFVYLGVNGYINGLINPALRVRAGEKITVMLVNSGEGEHDIVFPDLNVRSDMISKKGETVSVTFIAPNQDIAMEYHDSKFEMMGMKGLLLVGNVVDPEQTAAQAEVSPTTEPIPTEENPNNLPASISFESVSKTGIVVEYTLETGLSEGKMIYTGKGGEIDGQVNPDLKANPGDTVKITLISGEGAEHNIFFEGFDILSENVKGQGNLVTLEFVPDREGAFPYYCTIAGHRQAGMEGKFTVGSGQVEESDNSAQPTSNMVMPATTQVDPADESAIDIVRDPTDLPGPIGNRGPEQVRIDLETVEVSGILADGTTYHYWTFNNRVPGPFLRIRVGDTVEVHLKNSIDSSMFHSVDFHAVTGPGGGAVATQTQPGGETMFSFKALNPGLFVYHCATPMVAHHISNGMYGLILVEPEGGLPEVDREFYVMQGELYTIQPFGTTGNLEEDVNKLLNEDPEYFTFNGASMALTGDAHALQASTGDTVRIFFGVGGPNFTSSFHIIGEIFDRVYDQASLTANPLTDVQTTLVPPGGATMVEFTLDVPGRYILVDHALARLERGLAGFLYAEGDAAPDIFDGKLTPGSGH